MELLENNTFDGANQTINTTQYNNSSPDNRCWTIMARFENEWPVERFMFISFAVFGFVASMVNFLVINGIKQTNQWKNKSTRLILFVSICDAARAFWSYFLISVAVAFKSSLSCVVKSLMVFFSYFWIYITAYLFTLIALERYLRVTLCQDYQGYVTETKFKRTVTVLVLLVTYQCLSLCLGHFIIGKENTALGTVLVNIIMFLATIVLYLLSIKRLRHIASNGTISNETRKFTTMASTYLIIYFLCYLPVILYLSMSKMIFENSDIQTTGVIRILTYLATDVMSIVNSVYFLFRNRPCFRFYKKVILDGKKRLTQSNKVIPALDIREVSDGQKKICVTAIIRSACTVEESVTDPVEK